MPKKSSNQTSTRPKTFTHKTLGVFKLNESGDFAKTFTTGGRRFKVVLNCGHEDPDVIPDGPEACAKIAAICAKNLDTFISKAFDFAVKSNLKTKNNHLLNPGEKPYTPEKFRKKLKLKLITFDRDGGACWFDAGEMMWHHGIKVDFSSRGKFLSSDVPG